MTAPGEPFARASLLIGPVLEHLGFQLISREYEEGVEASAFAEYARGALRLRLVWEGQERALWVETARAAGGSIISRWTDVEWIVAGQQQPVDYSLDDDRLDRLDQAVVTYLQMINDPTSGGSNGQH